MSDLDQTVQRKLGVLYPLEADREEAAGILRQVMVTRVQLALLKVSGGNLTALRDNAETARVDFRDILMIAEERRSNRLFGRKITAEMRAEAERLDQEEYVQWLSS